MIETLLAVGAGILLGSEKARIKTGEFLNNLVTNGVNALNQRTVKYGNVKESDNTVSNPTSSEDVQSL